MGPNRFYNESDWRLFGRRSDANDTRTPFEVDRDRIIYTPAFRRLQAKTQVFMPGEYDFYRTRLTHSIEAAQAGRSICNHLRRTSPHLSGDFYPDPDLVEAVCLAHDLGHPPFGHAGERALNRLMFAFGGFEGNAQTVRLIIRLIYGEGGDRRGMAPTRALLDGISKYKRLWSELPVGGRENHFLYDDQRDVLDFLSEDFPGAREQSSLECQIMDWADDTAYSLNDIVDGFQAGFITRRKVEQWAGEHPVETDGQRAVLAELLETLHVGTGVVPLFGRKTGKFIRACRIEPRPGVSPDAPPRHQFDLHVAEEARVERDFYGRLAVDLVFRAPPLQHLEHKSDHLLGTLFQLLERHHIRDEGGLRLLPPATAAAIAAESTIPGRARLLCDYLAGMTDGFAIRTYKRLFDPEFGSITDLP